MRFPRTLRLDESDARVFSAPATAGEWAVTGAFRWAHRDPATFRSKERQAFRNGWLALDSFGDASLVEIAEIPDEAYEAATRRLAAHLIADYGAPDALSAVEVAREEMAFAASLCQHPPGAILSLEREFGDQGLIERVRIVTRSRAGDFSRVWNVRPE